MVVVPAGHFMRGSPQDEPGRDLDSRNHDEDDLEGPGGKRVQVSVPAFALGVFEVTNEQFGQFVDDTGYEMPGGCISDADGDGVWAAEESGTWKTSDGNSAATSRLPASTGTRRTPTCTG